MLLKRLVPEALPPHAVMLAPDVALICLPKTDDAAPSLPFDMQPPYGTVELTGPAGSVLFAAARLPDPDHEAAVPELENASAPFWPAPVILGSDIGVLTISLDAGSRTRLLNFLVGFCRQAFDLGANADFAAACLALAELALERHGEVSPVATFSDLWVLLDGFDRRPHHSCWSIGAGGVRKLTVLHPRIGPTMALVDRVYPGDVIVALGDRAASWVVGPARDRCRDLLHSEPDAHRLRASCLKELAPACPAIRASLRERAAFSPKPPIRHADFGRPLAGSLDAALSDGEGKVFLRGWLHDPLELVISAELQGFAGSTPVPLTQLQRFHRPDLEGQLSAAAFPDPGATLGFIAHIDDPCAGLSLQPTLQFRLVSGARMVLRPPLQCPTATQARSAVLTSAPSSHVDDVMLTACIGPAAAAFHRRSLADREAPTVVEIGRPVRHPRTSVVVPLYRNLSFLRFQVAAFASDPSMADAELIYVLDSPEQRFEVEHLLRGFHAMYGMPIRLVVLGCNMGYAAASNAGAALARAPALLLLNSDIVPERPGWLASLHGALAMPGVGAVGPKLLFDDGSIQHAGLFFDRDVDGIWFNAHFSKGMPRYWSAACKPREVPGLTGAAILLHRETFEAVDGFSEDYIVGDYEDSDLCLKIRALGKPLHYVPDAELFHFERKSIALHRGYSGTLACRYNRLLHNRRWESAIDALMAQSEFSGVSSPND